jgi:hypothetical protein
MGVSLSATLIADLCPDMPQIPTGGVQEIGQSILLKLWRWSFQSAYNCLILWKFARHIRIGVMLPPIANHED